LGAASPQGLAAGPAARELFADAYQGAQPIGEDQAKVVYYRTADGAQGRGAANVYLDRELVTALLPGGHAQFCLRPGQHILGAYLNEAYRYPGKREELYRATLEGGNTYYLKVREQGGSLPLSMERGVAERELRGSRAQAHLLNRASQVEPCRHYAFLGKPTLAHREYVLQADQVFAGRNGSAHLSDAGRTAVGDILRDLQRRDAQIVQVNIEGHTDPLGPEAGNQLLGQAWADAVRQSLIEQGAPQALLKASSLGNREPLRNSCYGSRDEQFACYAPNRRVKVEVEVEASR
jgi:OOP family OmpA-OmpF porin